MLRCLLRRNEQRGRLLQLLRCSVTSRNIAASAPSGGEAQNVHVTSAAGWAVAKTRVLAEAGYLGIAAKEALSACDAALAARGHATNIVVHYSDDPATVASAIGDRPAPSIGLRAVAWSPPTEVNAELLDSPQGFANQKEMKEVSVVAVSLPGRAVDVWHANKASVPALPDLEGALTTRPPHFFFLVSPSFPLEAFTRVLDNAFPSSSKAACRAFSGMELTDEIANSVRIVQPSDMPDPTRGSLQVLDLQSGSQSSPPVVFRAPAVGAAGSSPGGQDRSPGSSETTPPPCDVVAGSRGEPDPFAVGIAIAAPKSGTEASGPLPEGDFVSLVRHIQGDLRAAAYYFSDAVVGKLFLPEGVEPAGPGPSLTERNRILDSVGAADTATIPLLEIGVLAFPGGTEEFIVYELRYRTLLKGLLEGTRTPRVFGLTAGSVGTLVTLGGWNMMPDGRAHVTVHGGRRFTIVPGTTHVEPNHFGLAVGGVRFFDDDIAPDVDQATLQQQVSAAERQCRDLLDKAKALALETGGTTVFEESIHHALFHAEGRGGESRAERLSMELASILPTSHWVRARWLRERSSQRRLEQQLLTLKAAADEIVQSWAIQFYGAKSSTRFLRNNSKWSGVKRTGF